MMWGAAYVPWPYGPYGPWPWGFEARFPDTPECEGPCEFIWVPSAESYFCQKCNYRVRCLPELRVARPTRRTEPLYAVRAWIVVSDQDQVLLRSVYVNQTWPHRGWLVAEHDWEYGKQTPKDHFEHMDPNCTCGVHAFKPGEWRPQTSECVWGVVQLAGRILVCEKGYRAERGKVEALCYTTPFVSVNKPDPKKVSAAADTYQVPAYHRGSVMLAEFGLLREGVEWRGDGY